MSGSVWRFAGFVYSPQSGLQRDGVQIHLGPQARQLLELLLESKGGVVSKAEIAARLWPERPPSHDSIDRCAYLLRKPLRETGFGDLIATAYGRGLSLRAKVEAIDSEIADERPAEPSVEGRILDLWQTAYELAGARTPEGYERAASAIAAVIQLDGGSPAVWSLSADIAACRVIRGLLRPGQAAAMIEKDCRRALDVAPQFSAALAAMGWARATLSARGEEGLALLDQAVAQDPRYSKARSYRCWAFAKMGRLKDGIEDTETGLAMSPHNLGLLSMRAWLELCAGNVEASAELAQQGLKLRPDGGWLRSVVAIAASLSGRHAEAEESARQGLLVIPGDPAMLAVLAYVLASAGQIAEAGAALAAATANEQARAPQPFVAAALAALGRTEEAVVGVRRARDEGCPWFVFAPYDPRLAPLREEIARLRATPAEGPGG